MFSFFHSSTQTLVPWLVKWGGKRVEWNWWYFWVAIVLWANKMNAGSERPMCPWRQTSLCLFNSVDHVKNFERFLIPSKLWLSICVNMGLRRWAGELWVFCEYSFASLKNPVGPRWKLLNLKTFGNFFFFFLCICVSTDVKGDFVLNCSLSVSWWRGPIVWRGQCWFGCLMALQTSPQFGCLLQISFNPVWQFLWSSVSSIWIVPRGSHLTFWPWYQSGSLC